MGIESADNGCLVVVLGPTASGKTRLAVDLARRFMGEIISADSRQVFRGMDIGTGKDLAEYGPVKHHLIDIVEAGEEFSLFEFLCHFNVCCVDILKRGHLPILCGGTALYLDAVLRDYKLVRVPQDPELRQKLAGMSQGELVAELSRLKPDQHNRTDLLERERTIRAIEIAMQRAGEDEDQPMSKGLHKIVIGVRRGKQSLRESITNRLSERLEAGMVEEVRRLNEAGVSWERLDYYGLEYRYIGRYLKGELGLQEMFCRLESAIHDFAKRQGNWYRRMERQGVHINWIDGDGDMTNQASEIVSRVLQRGVVGE